MVAVVWNEPQGRTRLAALVTLEWWSDKSQTWVTKVGKKGHMCETYDRAIDKTWFLIGEEETGRDWKQTRRQTLRQESNDNSL